jgi:hypothetical protein
MRQPDGITASSDFRNDRLATVLAAAINDDNHRTRRIAPKLINQARQIGRFVEARNDDQHSGKICQRRDVRLIFALHCRA